MTSGMMPRKLYFAMIEGDARFRRHSGKGEAAEVDVIHHPAQVFADDREGGMRSVGAGLIS